MAPSPSVAISRPRRKIETVSYDLLELLAVVRDAAAGSTERERGTDDRGEADPVDHLLGFVVAGDDGASGARQPNLLHRLAE